MGGSRLADSQQEVYSVKTFVRQFGIGRSKVYEEIKAGRLRIRKAGTRTLIAHADAVSWWNNLPEGQSGGEYPE